jgi:O-antigen ligase
VHADPFLLLGWVPAIPDRSQRLAVYGTLGNPNFVAALMAGTAPLAAGLLISARSRARRIAWGGALACVFLAMLAAGSRAGALGLAAAGIAWASVAPWPARHRVAVLVVALSACALGVFTSRARPIVETGAGRLYIWRVAWPHAWQAPFVGHGPGAFEIRYPGWETQARASSAQAGRPTNARFAGPQQHAHNDYLEALVERGVPGAAAIFGLVVLVVIAGRRSPRDTLAAAGAASVAAVAAVAIVDFPLERPAEAALFWTAVSIALARNPGSRKEEGW